MKKLLLIAILFAYQHVVSQDFRFGKISKEELMEKSHPNFPEANAAILYKNQNIKFNYIQGKGFIQENEIHQRIKIYNKEGFDYATKLIKLYSNSEGTNTLDESLLGLKAYTYTLVDGKIEEEKLKKDGIFEEETNKFWKTTKFTMPNIKEGCVIEFQYTIQSQQYGIDDIEFQQSIPTNKFEFKLKTPEYFKYKSLLNPRASYIPKLTNSSDRGQITLTSKSRSYNATGGVKTLNDVDTINYTADVVSADLSNIPPLKDETYVDNVGNYQSKLIMELERIEFPNEPIKNLSTTWEKVTKTIYDDDNFGRQLEKKGYYDNDVNVLISGISDPKQKADLIFNHVKSKVKWNEYYGYTTDAGVAKAYKEGIGNSADINLMLVSMLRYVGLDANPILVSTKNNGIPLLPTRTGFNYVICGLTIDKNIILFDATQKYSTADILPTRSLNWMGRLIRKDQSSDWVSLIPETPSKETVSLNVKLNTDLSASGKVRNHYTDYQAFRVRGKYENFNNQEMIESVEKDRGELKVSNFVAENMNDVTQPILQSYEYSLDNAMEEIGGKLYFTPLMFLTPLENPFKEDKRTYPIDFVYPIADKYMVNIMLPEGYTVETLPESTKFEFNGTEGTFIYLARQNGGMLQFTISMDLNKALILASDYEDFKKFYQFLIEKQTEKVVLKKV